MTFNRENMTLVLKEIEKNISFQGSDLSNPQDWNFKIDLPVEDIIKCSPNESDKIRYVIKIFETLEYITFENGNYSVIHYITNKGIKFLFSELHNIEFI